MTPVPSRLLELPPEITTAILPHLLNRDIKSLRLTCKTLCATSQLRLNRVFLSANPRNIEVFRAVADHQVLRERVVEIVWDDARLKEGPTPRKSSDPESPNVDPDFNVEYDGVNGDYYEQLDGYSDEDSSDDDDSDYGPYWFAKACGRNLRDMWSHKGVDVDRPDHVARAELAAKISVKHIWKYYQLLLRQQRDVLAAGDDEEAFKYGLQRFPALRRVTITPAAHGMLFMPLYDTPMIRAFPPSFNYPIPCTWPLRKQVQKSWERSTESEKDIWRAFRIVIRTLAALGNASQAQQQQQQQIPNVTELVVDVTQLLTGLNARVFDEECTEQRYLATVLRQPSFRRLDLALAVGGLEHHGWRALRSGCLMRTLAAAPGLEHVSLKTDMWDAPDDDHPGLSAGNLHFPPLRDVFPVDAWARLSHFALARFVVRQDDLLSFLGALPPTLRSVELSFLHFLEGNYRDLLAGMRGQLVWCERPAGQRPRVAIGLPDPLDIPRRGIWADAPVEQFLYHHGPNPFGADGVHPDQIPQGWGGVVKDCFDPAFERPWVEPDELKRLGIIGSPGPATWVWN